VSGPWSVEQGSQNRGNRPNGAGSVTKTDR
jgi:hypothetical protein